MLEINKDLGLSQPLFFFAYLTSALIEKKGIVMDYSKISDRALLDMAMVASLKEDKTEAEAIMAELESRVKPKEKEVEDDFWF